MNHGNGMISVPNVSEIRVSCFLIFLDVLYTSGISPDQNIILIKHSNFTKDNKICLELETYIYSRQKV